MPIPQEINSTELFKSNMLHFISTNKSTPPLLYFYNRDLEEKILLFFLLSHIYVIAKSSSEEIKKLIYLFLVEITTKKPKNRRIWNIEKYDKLRIVMTVTLTLT